MERLENETDRVRSKQRVVANLAERLAAKRTSPAVGSSSAPSIWRNVDFPHPLGPATATDSPSPIVMLIPRNACTRPPSKERRKSRVSINATRESSGMERNKVPLEETFHDAIEFVRLLQSWRVPTFVDELSSARGKCSLNSCATLGGVMLSFAPQTNNTGARI